MLKRNYIILLQIGLILSLLLFIFLFKNDFNIREKKIKKPFITQEVVKMEEIEMTKQSKSPPPPPRPKVPVVVPNNEVIEDEIIDFSADLDLDSPLNLPSKPPKQEEKNTQEEDEIFIVVEQMPELIGGMKTIYTKITYPDIARLAGIEGRVMVNFIIDENGNTINHKILRGIGGGCDEEALRVSKLIKFKPGRQRGVPVKVNYTLPITFKIRKINK